MFRKTFVLSALAALAIGTMPAAIAAPVSTGGFTVSTYQLMNSDVERTAPAVMIAAVFVTDASGNVATPLLYRKRTSWRHPQLLDKPMPKPFMFARAIYGPPRTFSS